MGGSINVFIDVLYYTMSKTSLFGNFDMIQSGYVIPKCKAMKDGQYCGT